MIITSEEAQHGQVGEREWDRTPSRLLPAQDSPTAPRCPLRLPCFSVPWTRSCVGLPENTRQPASPPLDLETGAQPWWLFQYEPPPAIRG